MSRFNPEVPRFPEGERGEMPVESRAPLVLATPGFWIAAALVAVVIMLSIAIVRLAL